MWKKPNPTKLTRPYRKVAEVLHKKARTTRGDTEYRLKKLAEVLTGIPQEEAKPGEDKKR